ncbi:MAG TPA: hypothetical protein VNW48_00435, partial [Xanthobacteraceae bacterium]|nr:hypothetical protein [Xanthobacteraceae bacterium]
SPPIYIPRCRRICCASPKRHIGWSGRIGVDPVLQQPYPVKDGCLEIPNRPGAGIEWDEGAVTRYRYDA